MDIDAPAQVQLAGTPFNVMRYEKSDQQVFGPRFGSGSVDESDLTLLKTETYKVLDDGSFSPRSNAKIQPYMMKGYPDFSNKTLGQNWVIESRTANTIMPSSTSTTHSVTAYTQWKGRTVFAVRHGSLNELYTFDYFNGLVKLTVPASGADPFHLLAVKSFAFYNDVLYMANSNTRFFYLTTAWALVQHPHTSNSFSHLFNLNGKMYDLSMSGQLLEISGTTSALTVTLVTEIRDPQSSALTTSSAVRPLAVLNGRAYMGFGGAIWCFDGVRAYQVYADTLRPEFWPVFTVFDVAQGWLYFDQVYSLWRFNGSTIEKVLDFPTDMNVIDSFTYGDNLFLNSRDTVTNPVANYFKLATTPTNYRENLWCYDGNVMVKRANLYPVNGTSYANKVMPGSFGFFELLIARTGGATSVSTIYAHNHPDFVGPADSDLAISFRSMDMGLPGIDKIYRGISVNFSEEIDNEGEFQVYYRFDPGDTWIKCKAFTDTNTNFLSGDFDVTIPPNKSIFFLVQIYGIYDVHLESISVHYLLATPYRRQWNMQLSPDVNTIDNESVQGEANDTAIDSLRTSQIPFTFVDVDGHSREVILDSFSKHVIPTSEPQGTGIYEATYSVVLREV